MTVATVLPKIIDRWRGLRNGKRKWTGVAETLKQLENK